MRAVIATFARLLPAAGAAAIFSFSSSAAPLPVERSWSEKVLPVLEEHCLKCHGGVRQRGGLDLRSLQNILQGGDSGPALIPGLPQESNLLQFLHAEADTHMPPKKQLAPVEISTIEEWIAELPKTESLNVSRSEPGWQSRYTTALTALRQPVWIPPADLPATQVIDRFVELGWRERAVIPAAGASDREFLRRVYLDLAGRIPTAAESAEFLTDPSASKRERLVDSLLASADYPRHMREVFDVVLMERKGNRAEKQREENRWFEFLETVFRENRPWNAVVADLILARAGETNSPGAAWFLYERRNNHQAMAEAIAPVAYGVRIDCAQCHNHPLAWEIEQRHYWGLVAAFSRSKNTDSNSGNGVAESAVGGFITFANLKKESQPALLAFLNGKVVDEKRPADGESEKDDPALYLVPPPPEKEKAQAPSIPRFSRREALAAAVTENNPQLAKAFVNRIWAMLLGRGLVHPVDKIDSKHPASHPDLLDWLARDFESSGYDIKRLIRSIVLSRPYQLDSRPAGGSPPLPQAFARALEKPLSGEQLYRSIVVAAGVQPDAEGKIAGRSEEELRRLFVERFPELFAEVFNPTLQQATFISNSTVLDQLLSRASGSTTDHLLQLSDPATQVTEAFRRFLGRPPAPDELDHALQLIARRPGEAGLKHLLWALLASAEFQFNH